MQFAARVNEELIEVMFSSFKVSVSAGIDAGGVLQMNSATTGNEHITDMRGS